MYKVTLFHVVTRFLLIDPTRIWWAFSNNFGSTIMYKLLSVINKTMDTVCTI